MAELKTKKTNDPVNGFLDSIENEKKRNDSYRILEIMEEVSNMKPRMWGSSIIGFGDKHYKYESGREGDWFIIGFSPRKANIALYNLMPGLKQHEHEHDLGKYKTGKSCIYINKLADINEDVLKDMIRISLEQHKEKTSNGCS